MPEYIKKPVVVEAIKWETDMDQAEYPTWLTEAIGIGLVWFENGNMYINTLEGIFTATNGDYIIKGTHGELYPCKPWIFESNYDKVEKWF